MSTTKVQYLLNHNHSPIPTLNVPMQNKNLCGKQLIINLYADCTQQTINNPLERLRIARKPAPFSYYTKKSLKN
ncbi:unnamed protein product [Trifolium pratense]|uniref:Uncharacterized protein n=1 Tax=Trifolium pratense TaxID=57577 RepID=A0ACB0KCA3_TRIPR|nr:unnamed protein product [Trifolium pratense]